MRLTQTTNPRGRPDPVSRASELPGKNRLKNSHPALAAALPAAYGFSPKKDLPAQLPELNLTAAAAEKTGHPVAAAGRRAPDQPAAFPHAPISIVFTRAPD